MVHEHTVRAFDEALAAIADGIRRMGGLAESQLAGAIEAVVKRDGEIAARVIEQDRKVDDLERQIDDMAIKLLALRAPVASDLRLVLTALKVSAEIERIADYAKNVAKRAVSLNELPAVQPVYSIPRMGRAALAMLKDVLDAYNANDAAKALEVWNRDETLDDLYTSLFRELLTYMMEDARNITPCTHLLFIAKNLERIGDHCTNIAENVYFLVTGRQPGGERPKGGKDELNVVAPTKQAPS
jgi:phosphate transport system protein